MSGGFQADAFQHDAFDIAAVDANAYTRMMMALLPPGKVWRLITGSTLFNLLAACADELGRLEGRSVNLLDEADPSKTLELLPEYERELDLPSTGTNGERVARIVAREIARQRFRPVDFQNALTGLLGLAPASVVVIERTHAAALAMGDAREIYRFFIYRDPALPGTYYLASAQALVDDIKPSHTIGTMIESINFLCDDPYSLCDRDLLGA